MKMRPGDTPGSSYSSQKRACGDALTRPDIQGREVRVKSINAQAVIHDHSISGKEQRLCQDHAAALRSIDRSARRRGKVHAGMRGACLSVQDAPTTEVFTRNHARERKAKRPTPQARGSHRGKDFAQPLLLRLGASQLVRIGLDKLSLNPQPFGGEMACSYCHSDAATERRGVLRFRGDSERIVARGLFQIDAQETSPSRRAFSLGVIFPPEEDLFAAPLAFYLVYNSRAAHFRQEQATLAWLRRAQTQPQPRRTLRRSGRWCSLPVPRAGRRRANRQNYRGAGDA